MSRENLSQLLDNMLDDSALDQAADQVRAEEERQAKARKEAAATLHARAKEEREAVRIQRIDELTGLTEEDLRLVLAKAAPDDLLVILATAGDVLMRRILGNLDESSVAWLRENLAYMERVTDGERDSAHGKVIKAANALLAAGKISVPEPESVGAAAAPDGLDKDLRDLLTDLVRIADQVGEDALSELAAQAGEPLLEQGLGLVLEGKKGTDLRRGLGAVRGQLEKAYAQRLLWIEEALVAIGEGETADSFRARLFEKK